jgi:NADH-quinone oxidoreductase subunit G
LGRRLPFDSIGQLQRRLFAANPRFQELDSLQSAAWAEFGQPGHIDAAPFALPVTNFYMTDPISRASETMAQCSEAFGGGQTQKTGTHG